MSDEGQSIYSPLETGKSHKDTTQGTRSLMEDIIDDATDDAFFRDGLPQSISSEPLINPDQTSLSDEEVTAVACVKSMTIYEDEKVPTPSIKAHGATKTDIGCQTDASLDRRFNLVSKITDDYVSNNVLKTKLAHQEWQNENLKAEKELLMEDKVALKEEVDLQDRLETDLRKKLDNIHAEKQELLEAYLGLEADVERQKITHGLLIRELEGQRVKLEAQGIKLEKADELCQELRESWIEATEELQELQKTRKRFEVDDDYVISLWNGLVYRIRNLAAKASVYKGPLSTPTDEQHEIFGNLAPHFEKYFPAYASILFEAIIWRKINAALIAPSSVWSTQASETIYSLFQSMLKRPVRSQDDYSRCHEWRVETAILLEEFYDGFRDGLDDRGQQEIVNNIYIDIKRCAHDFEAQDLLTDIRGIVVKLLAFCSTIAQAKALYHVFHPHVSEFMADRDEFRVMTIPDQESADLMVSPGLCKYGNEVGEDYELYTVLCKGGVAI